MDFGFLSDPAYDVWGAFWVTVQLTVYAAIGSLLWGIMLAAMRVGPVPVMRIFGTGYITILRNTPLTVIIISCSLVLSNTLGLHLADTSSATFIKDNNFRLAVLGLVAYHATFVCEAVRSGINTVPPGQAEAARAIGLPFRKVLLLVVLPQAVRAVVAPLASVLIALTKNTTVAASIGVAEAAVLMGTLVEYEPGAIYAVFCVMAAGFVLLTLPVGLLLGWVANRVAVQR